MIKLNDIFWTLQGEGQNWGRRALFIRLPFCNLACSWCDTSFNTFEKWPEDKFIEFCLSEPSRFAVITGGEPSMNVNLPRIVEILKELKFEIAIESNGTFPIPEGIDFITVSPKSDADYHVHPSVFDRVNEFKYVVDDGFDFGLLSRHNNSNSVARLSLSPEFNNFKKSTELIINFIKENPQWRMSLQTHKWLNIP